MSDCDHYYRWTVNTALGTQDEHVGVPGISFLRYTWFHGYLYLETACDWMVSEEKGQLLRRTLLVSFDCDDVILLVIIWSPSGRNSTIVHLLFFSFLHSRISYPYISSLHLFSISTFNKLMFFLGTIFCLAL